ncbi:MAG TPA: DmsC/YnfH family molybdoenzyme membrane anchor subunit [Candidatus Limnocylindria bacterium]|nr:DmsC/YnfH family molybdoenzyme membrane anchor subunit [Candidatus Limnocylindria bacterium]
MLKTGHDGDPEEEVSTLIDQLLAEQRQLTAVARFSRAHDRHEGPLLESHYRDLIPLTAPRPGEQFAFEVNLDQCSGCKGCVTACHSLNGLDDDESWREVGFLVGEAIVPLAQVQRAVKKDGGKSAVRLPYVPSPGNKVIPLQQTVTTACHHCVEPGCMLGCPVLAYDKDPVTGIVRHLDDQCIGCSYCILKCPYDVPKYSAKRGIVRKCDMCHGRLAEGEAPACVQACPNEAIRITLVKPAELAAQNRKAEAGDTDCNGWLADAPDPAITLPTTRYLSSKSNFTLRAADHSERKPQPAHWPLVLMLVLTQAGIGGFFAVAALSIGGIAAGITPWLAAVSFALLCGGLLASVFHLGQPMKAWRVWLGWRTSWLSREAIALNAFAVAATGALALLWAVQASQLKFVPPPVAEWLRRANEIPVLLWIVPVVGLGLVALYAQTMVYADTYRKFWRIGSTAPRFLGSALVLGTALAFAFAPSSVLAVALILLSLPKLANDVAILKHADSDSDRWTQLRHTAALQLGPLRPVLVLRLLAGLVGGVCLPFAFAEKAAPPAVAGVALALCLLGEISERYLFFTSVAPDKMPGMP